VAYLMDGMLRVDRKNASENWEPIRPYSRREKAIAEAPLKVNT